MSYIRTSSMVRLVRPLVRAYRERVLLPRDVMIASYPKSGNTWLRMMLASMYASGAQSFDDLSFYVPELEKLRSCRQCMFLQGGRLVKTHEPWAKRYAQGIYIIRDCRDVVKSYWRHQLRTGQYTGTLEGFSEKFVKGACDNYGRWSHNVSSWLNASERWPDRYLVLRYEDLLAEPSVGLTRISQFLQAGLPLERIRAAIESNTKSRMRQKEKRSQTIQYNGDSTISFVSEDGGPSKTALCPEVEEMVMRNYGAVMRRAGYEV